MFDFNFAVFYFPFQMAPILAATFYSLTFTAVSFINCHSLFRTNIPLFSGTVDYFLSCSLTDSLFSPSHILLFSVSFIPFIHPFLSLGFLSRGHKNVCFFRCFLGLFLLFCTLSQFPPELTWRNQNRKRERRKMCCGDVHFYKGFTPRPKKESKWKIGCEREREGTERMTHQPIRSSL